MTAIESFLGAGEGSEVLLHPDYIIVNDGPSSVALDYVRQVKDKDQVLVFHDHDVPTGSSSGAALYKRLNNFRKQYDLRFIAAKGIAYQHLVDEVVKPGELVLGAGTHGSIYAAAGAVGLDVSAEALAQAIETGEYAYTVPPTYSVKLEGSLPEGVLAYDAGLALRKLLQGKEQYALEISSSLCARDQAVVASIVSECVQTVLFTDMDEADEVLDLSKLKPMAMLPVDKREDQAEAEIVEVSGLDLASFKAGQIGGYTAGTIEVLRRVRDNLKGKHVRFGFRLTIVPATSQDYLKALEEGIITDFIDFGAQVVPFSDRSVVSQGAGVLGGTERLLTTGLYTFTGCMGMLTSEVYSASSLQVARAATGEY